MDEALRTTPEAEAERMRAVHRYDVLDSPPDGAFDRVTALAAQHFDVPVAIVSIVDHDRIWFKSHHGLEVDEIGRDPGLCASAILHDEPWVIENAAVDPRTLANPLVAGDMGLRFYAGAQLETPDGHNLGTLCIIDKEPRHLGDDEVSALEDFAAIVMDELELRLRAREAVSTERKLRGFAESTARALQASLLPPQLPVVPGAELAAFYEPADAAEVGGDFYDVFAVEPGRWAVVMGDVSGKGAEAAAVTALARHTIRTASLAHRDPAEILRVLNQGMFLGRESSELAHFCTVHVSFLTDVGSGRFALSSASAGHPPALRRSAGEITPLEAAGPPVGWYEDPEYTSVSAELGPGDALVAYTDGLTEARRAGEQLDVAAVVEVLGRDAGAGAQDIADQLHAVLDDPGVDVRDDAAVLVVVVG